MSYILTDPAPANRRIIELRSELPDDLQEVAGISTAMRFLIDRAPLGFDYIATPGLNSVGLNDGQITISDLLDADLTRALVDGLRALGYEINLENDVLGEFITVSMTDLVAATKRS